MVYFGEIAVPEDELVPVGGVTGAIGVVGGGGVPADNCPTPSDAISKVTRNNFFISKLILVHAVKLDICHKKLIIT
jgi:hypothetical protein